MAQELGGKSAKEGKGMLWKYSDNKDGSFICPEPNDISRLYFPLMNRYGMKCSVTPNLKGDICSNFHNYHSIPTVTEDIHRIVNNRNFWIRVEGHTPWSVPGLSTWERSGAQNIKTTAIGEIGIFKLNRINEDMGLEADISVFVPPIDDYVELITIKIKNTCEKPIKITPFSAIPIYGRSADNLRDHRNVTSMFNRITKENHGVRIRPNITFNEFGHIDNETQYMVYGFGQNGEAPIDIYPTVRDFVGEGGSLDCPDVVVNNKSEDDVKHMQIDGFEAIGAMRFEEKELKAGQEAAYVIINGISDNQGKLEEWKSSFGDYEKAKKAEKDTKEYWQKIVNEVEFESGNTEFDNWTKWVNYQLICRQVFGNSYLLDFGYGRGGRGWRDLFSDLLSIFLIDPESATKEIINNFNGIRVDGTNATIIGTKPGEFIADRNNVPRTWSDHSTWPFFVLNFYMHQTGHFDVLFKEVFYWKDRFGFRGKSVDHDWDESYGHKQKSESGEIYKASILEHVLIQHFCSFFNVGQNNNILLEGADWNDTYDMAREKGESVCFYNWYGNNMKVLAKTLEHLKSKGIQKVDILEEVLMLMDNMKGNEKVDYSSPEARQNHLKEYYKKVTHNISGNKVAVEIDEVINDLNKKADEVYSHIRKNEWITTKDGESFFNGHYDNDAKRLHGDHPKGVRMDLTSQVIPTIFEVATDDQIPIMYKSVRRYLRDDNTGGLHLCTNFNEEKLYFGRLTSFVYGHKEHGGKWMQQNAMFMYGLYKRGFVDEGYEVYKEMFELCHNSKVSKIFPGIPSYFELDGRGSYNYLTGSATWLMLALVTQVYGLKGEYGNMCVEPKLVKEQFGKDNSNIMKCSFKGKKLNIAYKNENCKNWNEYTIQDATLNDKSVKEHISENGKALVIPEDMIDSYLNKETNDMQIILD